MLLDLDLPCSLALSRLVRRVRLALLNRRHLANNFDLATAEPRQTPLQDGSATGNRAISRRLIL